MFIFLSVRFQKQLALTIATALLLMAVAAQRVPARDLAADVDSLFNLGTKSSPSAVAAAKSHYERLKRGHPGDRRIDYAYAIVLANQHKFLETAQLFSDLPKDGKPEFATSPAKVWALVQGRKTADALQELVRLSQGIAQSGDGDLPGAPQDQTARFIGAMFGYLELIRPAAVDVELRANQRNVVLKNLGDRYAGPFDAGCADVADRLADLKAARTLAQERKAAANKERLERDKTILQEDRGEMASSEEAMQAHLEGVRDAQRELNDINTQLNSLRTDRTRISAQIVTIQAQISELQTNNSTTIFRQFGERFPVSSITTNRTFAGPTTAEFAQVAALSVSLGRLNKQAFDMDRWLLALQHRAAELSDRGLQEADALDRHGAAAERTARHAKALEKKINRESARPKTSASVLSSQMTALSTYLPFPYEQERKRVLAWFK